MLESLVKEAKALGETLCITAIYLGIGTAIYHGCTGRLLGEAENIVKVQEDPVYKTPGIDLQYIMFQ